MVLQQQQAEAQNQSQIAMQQFNQQTQAQAAATQQQIAQMKAQMDLMKGKQQGDNAKELEIIKQRGDMRKMQGEALLNQLNDSEV